MALFKPITIHALQQTVPPRSEPNLDFNTDLPEGVVCFHETLGPGPFADTENC